MLLFVVVVLGERHGEEVGAIYFAPKEGGRSSQPMMGSALAGGEGEGGGERKEVKRRRWLSFPKMAVRRGI